MAKLGTSGVPGSAVLLGTAGLYLVYVGVKDVSFFDGLRSILRKQRPTPRATHGAYSPEIVQAARDAGAAAWDIATDIVRGDDSCIRTGATALTFQRLVGNARSGYCTLKKKFPSVEMGGWRAEARDREGHPSGKAVDFMTTNDLIAQSAIAIFKRQAGAKYYIWRQTYYSGPLWAGRRMEDRGSPTQNHMDHVHFQWS